jgi:hypothetical protein
MTISNDQAELERLAPQAEVILWLFRFECG